jgi:hypothetical protein
MSVGRTAYMRLVTGRITTSEDREYTKTHKPKTRKSGRTCIWKYVAAVSMRTDPFTDRHELSPDPVSV